MARHQQLQLLQPSVASCMGVGLWQAMSSSMHWLIRSFRQSGNVWSGADDERVHPASEFLQLRRPGLY